MVFTTNDNRVTMPFWRLERSGCDPKIHIGQTVHPKDCIPRLPLLSPTELAIAHGHIAHDRDYTISCYLVPARVYGPYFSTRARRYPDFSPDESVETTNIGTQAMREEERRFFRITVIAGFSVIICIILIFAAIVGCAKRTSFNRPERDRGVRDLELGDLKCESHRDGDRDPLLDGRQGNGTSQSDEYDIFANPWQNKSLDTLVAPDPVYLPLSAGGSRGLNPESGAQRGLDLSDPEIFNIPTSHAEDPFADSTPEPPPVRPALISFRTLTSLGPRFLRWKAQALGDGREDRDEARDIEDIPTTVTGDLDLTALSAAVATARNPPYDPLPEWLITPKATAGPRAPRFIEVDVDGPTINPPDHEFVAEQHELLARVPIPARPGMPRSSTWHPGHDSGVEEGSSRPGVVRNQTCAV